MENNIVQQGKQSLLFSDAPGILSSASVVGKKEGEGPLGNMFDMVGEDPMFGCESWEDAESTLQKEAFTLAIGKSDIEKWQLRYIFAGDLLGQEMASSFGLADMQIPLFGVYGACSTAGESLSLAALSVASGAADYVMAITSSHFASAEKQFRFPLAYGNQRPPSSTWTVTGSGAFVVGKDKGIAKITGVTTGKIVDFGVTDSMNMGACMAPAACDTIYQNFMDFSCDEQQYDKIITGDLGDVGYEILVDLMKDKGFDISGNLLDCGRMIFDKDTQGTNSGGSGCGCSATVLSALILQKLKEKTWYKFPLYWLGVILNLDLNTLLK